MNDEPDFFLPATGIGGNNPPDMTVTAAETMQALSDWMAENPVVQDESTAREAKLFIDRGKLCIKDLEDERDGKVRPLNEQVKAINEEYRAPRESLRVVLDQLTERLGDFLRREEHRRILAANEARQRLEEAERAAREAESAALAIREEAGSGVVGGDVAAATLAADDAYRQYEKAQRAEALAEKETKVKVGGGFSRAVSLRTEVILTVTDPVKAIRAIGVNDDINAAIIKAARAFKKLKDRYPEGIEVQTERKV